MRRTRKLIPPVRASPQTAAPAEEEAQTSKKPESRGRGNATASSRNTNTSPDRLDRSGRTEAAAKCAGHAKTVGSSPSPPPKSSSGQLEEARSSGKPCVLTVSSNAAVPSCECRLGPLSMRSLQLYDGSLVCIETAVKRVYVEAFSGVSMSSKSVVVGDCIAAVLGETSATLSVPPPLSEADNLAHVYLDVYQDHGGESAAPHFSSELQWRSLFRTKFANRVVCLGMAVRLSIATLTVHLEVVRIDDGREYGLVGDMTELHICRGGSGGASAATSSLEAPSESLASSSPAGIEGHTLFVGEPGTGKSFNLERLADEDRRRGRRVLMLRVEELPQGGGDVSTVTVIREAFLQARHSAPCTICLDDIDLLCAKTHSSVGSQWAIALVTHALAEEMRAIRDLPIRVVATAHSTDQIPDALLCPDGLGHRIVRITPPVDAAERLVCLTSCVTAAGIPISAIDADALQDVAAHAHAFTHRDLRRVVDGAMLESFRRRQTSIFTAEELTCVAATVRPSSLRQFEVSIPDVTWGDIGGSEAAKTVLQEVVAWSLGKHKEVFQRFRLNPPRGVLLYGPPGCSKTMLAKALANESRMNFISIKGPEVFSKWVGDSEKAVREIFTRARAASPCVVFIDELDGMCGHRGRGGVSDRVISQFLTELDGLPAASTEREHALVFVAATNRPDSIDGAVLRPGRIDRRVHVGLPEEEERAAIAKIQFRRVPTAPDLTPNYIATRTEGYSGAEVVAVVKEAAYIAIAADTNAPCVTCGDVEAALRKVRPRISPKDVEWYKQWPHVVKAN